MRLPESSTGLPTNCGTQGGISASRDPHFVLALCGLAWRGFGTLCGLHFCRFCLLALRRCLTISQISVFNEMRFALNTLPETFINMLQGFVSMRRIENYLNGAEVSSVSPLDGSTHAISVQSATLSWPQTRSGSASASATNSAAPTPARKFMLIDVSLNFPQGELSLICGKLGSGKTLLLLGRTHFRMGWHPLTER
jgi:ABC-type multidrug transport system fused ATPase/permease subunit